MTATSADVARVTELLGHAPRGDFEVVVRREDGDPVVIRNPPLLDDGTPMPTRWWLVGRSEREAVARLEAAGGVREAERAVEPRTLAAAHARYARERDAALPPSHSGARPAGGVGGTRKGVKCLHAHVAWYLAGGDDPVGRWAALHAGIDTRALERARGPVAAVDCGTNSTRLLVADGSGRQLEREMRITRLGEGVDRTGMLSAAAIARTLEVVEDFRRTMDAHGVESARAIATSAVRDAGNPADFLEPVGAAAGVPLEVLGGEEEGSLAFLGATSDLEGEERYLVVDIGGGSTEFVVGKGGPDGVVSVDMGCVRLTERFLRHDPPLESEVREARNAALALTREAGQWVPGIAGADRLVGLAGTVSTLAAISAGVADPCHGAVHHLLLTREEVDRLAAELASDTRKARLRRPGLEEARADVIVGGALVLSAVMEGLGFGSCLVSESDILDGLVMSQLRD
jgi:exopolyphosphatase/guanosine-5'-triphosphate,3'-diphosphate pyrophosphatase